MKKTWKLIHSESGEKAYRVPLKDEIEAVKYFERKGYDVGTDAYYDDPDRYVTIIVREDETILPKIPNPLGLPDPLGITDNPDDEDECPYCGVELERKYFDGGRTTVMECPSCGERFEDR